MKGVSGMVLIICLMKLSLQAQVHNGQVYRQLLSTYLQQHPGTYAGWGGYPLAAYVPPLEADSTAAHDVRLDLPMLRYVRTAPRQYIRFLDLPIAVGEKQDTLRYTDTLSARALRRVIRRSPESLQGKDPTAWTRWAWPLTLVSVSLAGVVSLFYLRSR